MKDLRLVRAPLLCQALLLADELHNFVLHPGLRFCIDGAQHSLSTEYVITTLARDDGGGYPPHLILCRVGAAPPNLCFSKLEGLRVGRIEPLLQFRELTLKLAHLSLTKLQLLGDG